jgi:hypothetical protein
MTWSPMSRHIQARTARCIRAFRRRARSVRFATRVRGVFLAATSLRSKSHSAIARRMLRDKNSILSKVRFSWEMRESTEFNSINSMKPKLLQLAMLNPQIPKEYPTFVVLLSRQMCQIVTRSVYVKIARCFGSPLTSIRRTGATFGRLDASVGIL